MDFIDPILSLASQIYQLVDAVKANGRRCRRVSARVQALDNLVRSVKSRGKAEPAADVETALRELSFTLQSARELIEKYTVANWLKRVVKSSSHGDEFDSVNERLNDAYQALSVSLQVEQGNMLHMVFKLDSRKEEEEDRREDEEELKKMLLDYMKVQEEKLENLRTNVEKIVETLKKPSITKEEIRLIKASELSYEHPKTPFMTSADSEVYKGEYRGFTVAIKRYTEPVNSSIEVKIVFDKEVQTMKRFESPNILRMFGICVQDEDGPSPQFLIIMEYCEKGSLRQVLDSDCELSWNLKARMCLDTAQGLYRLHHTEEKSKVHGSIDSSRFLVAEGYRVKLGGFELAQTQTTLKKLSKGKAHSTTLCYTCPQNLENINHTYSKECEMYSFGIVMWEISTRQRPFKDCSRQDILKKVCKDKVQEPLPADCPESLRELINACRAYDSFQRPSAGVLVDKLRSVVAQLEEQ